MRTKILMFIALMLLAGCATVPTNQEFVTGDPGPSLEDPSKRAVEAIGRNLIDSWSAHYRLCEPQKAWRKLPQFGGGGPTVYGWMVCGEVNAKNRSGGYTGWKPVAVFFRAGSPPETEWGNTAFQWCGGELGGFITPGKSSTNFGCPEIK